MDNSQGSHIDDVSHCNIIDRALAMIDTRPHYVINTEYIVLNLDIFYIDSVTLILTVLNFSNISYI